MCSLPGFGLFIGYGTLILYSIILIVSIGLLADKKLVDGIVDDIADKENDVNIYATTIAIRFAIVFTMIVGVIMIIVSAYLIKGIDKKRPMPLIPWLLITFICIVGCLIYNFVVLLTSENPAQEFVVGMSIVVLQCAIFYPIYTLYRKMRKEKFPAPVDSI
ncbi:uncharacterized protein LOC131803365 [Musca domestica]|uniref:Uncharacterized protein LOC131803365 n=1 Tax=Musca domestica TaxID=7370 RepID=A0A1I8NJE3_MUSDO|nr:uncharacterized protein LOC131803365 [Musca domestica]